MSKLTSNQISKLKNDVINDPRTVDILKKQGDFLEQAIAIVTDDPEKAKLVAQEARTKHGITNDPHPHEEKGKRTTLLKKKSSFVADSSESREAKRLRVRIARIKHDIANDPRTADLLKKDSSIKDYEKGLALLMGDPEEAKKLVQELRTKSARIAIEEDPHVEKFLQEKDFEKVVTVLVGDREEAKKLAQELKTRNKEGEKS